MRGDGGQPGYVGGIKGLYELLSILALLRDHEGWSKGSFLQSSKVPNIFPSQQPMSGNYMNIWKC